MEDFTKEYTNGIVIISVNFTRATLKEANILRKLIDEEIILKNRKIILDLSSCEFIDSTFLGVIVFQHKRIITKSGILFLVEPKNLWQDLFVISGTLKLLNLFQTKEDAIKEIWRRNGK